MAREVLARATRLSMSGFMDDFACPWRPSTQVTWLVRTALSHEWTSEWDFEVTGRCNKAMDDSSSRSRERSINSTQSDRADCCLGSLIFRLRRRAAWEAAAAAATDLFRRSWRSSNLVVGWRLAAISLEMMARHAVGLPAVAQTGKWLLVVIWKATKEARETMATREIVRKMVLQMGLADLFSGETRRE